MLLDTMTVAEVATAKGVSEAAIRFAANDPQNKSLLGIKAGGRLLILTSSVEAYKPRNYPHLQAFIEAVSPDSQQQRILVILADLAASMVEEHPAAARILRSAFPSGNIAVNGRAGYGLGLVLPEDLRSTGREGTATIEVIFPSDNKKTIERKAWQWALRLVEEEWVKEG
jgi:hypothetical protein